MSILLGEFLVKQNLVTKTQLEEALQAQVIFGGKIGTILIEMGAITEENLAKVLSKKIGIPCAPPGSLERIPENVIKTISPELAEKYKVCPLSLDGRKLTLVMADPQDLKAIDDISFRSGFIIKPMLGLEVRLIFALERYYGIKRAMRYIAPPKQVKSELDNLEIEKGKKQLRKDAEEEYLGAPLNEMGQVEGVQPPAPKPAPEPVPEPVPEPEPEEVNEEDGLEELEDIEITLEETAAALVEARDRDAIAEAVIDYLGSNFSRAAMFMVLAGQVTGWRSIKHGVSLPGFDEFQMPLSEPSILKTAVDSQSYFLGPVPQTGANLALAAVLGKPAPKTALLMPLTMLGRVVGLIYVDDPASDLSDALADIQKLASKTLMALEILILQSKILRS